MPESVALSSLKTASVRFARSRARVVLPHLQWMDGMRGSSCYEQSTISLRLTPAVPKISYFPWIQNLADASTESRGPLDVVGR